MSRKETHVVPAGKKGWAVEKNGSKRVTAYYETKKEAVAAGRVISRNQGTEFIVHGKMKRNQRPNSPSIFSKSWCAALMMRYARPQAAPLIRC